MKVKLADAGHLVVLAIVFFIFLGVFLMIRAAVVPEGFGKYGHFRPQAIDDNRNHPVSFAGQQACAMCHEEAVAARGKGKHAMVSCEACHGALASHAEDPSSKPKLPDAEALCVRCHEQDAAKPRGFPQVASQEHSGGAACNGCHQPHAPKIQ